MRLHRLIDALLAAVARVWQDKRGATAIMVATALPVLLGFETLGVETGLWYMIKRQNQSAADAAAIAAAYEILAGKTDVAANLAPAVNEAVARNGYTGAAPQVVYPYADSIVSNGVAIFLQQSQRGLFTSMFLPGVTIASKAVAMLGVLDSVCVLSLSTTATGVEVDSSSHLDASGCAVAANSTTRNAIDIRSSTGLLSASSLITPGAISLQGIPIDPAALPPAFSLTLRPLIGAPGTANPYENVLTHAFLGGQIPASHAAINSWPTGTTTVVPAHYSGGMSVGTNASIDLQPGPYYVTDGDFTIASGATVTCGTCGATDGVTIILTSINGSAGAVGNVKIASGARVTLRAPSSGPYSGLLFLQDPRAISAGGNSLDNVLAGGSAMNLTGLLYFPMTNVRFAGNPGANCTLLIASRVVTNGDARFGASNCASAGLSGGPAVYTATLVE